MYLTTHSAVSYAKTAEPIDFLFGLWTWLDQRKHGFNHIRQMAPVCPDERSHWCHLVNMIKPSISGGDAALCQITLTTCYYYYYLKSKNASK